MSNWNKTVGVDDRIFMLGDFAIGEPEQSFCVSVERIDYVPIERNAMLNKMKSLTTG